MRLPPRPLRQLRSLRCRALAWPMTSSTASLPFISRRMVMVRFAKTNSSDSEPPPFSFLGKFLHVVHNADQLNPSSPYRVFMDDGIAVAPRGSLFFTVE